MEHRKSVARSRAHAAGAPRRGRGAFPRRRTPAARRPHADDALVLGAEVTYTRHDAAVVTVPAVAIFHLAGWAPGEPDRPVADQCRINVDLAPLFAPGA